MCGKELKLFVGIHESDELENLGRIAKKDGYQTARSWDKLNGQIWRERPEVVRIAGAQIGYCVAMLAQEAMDSGVMAVVDLNNSRLDEFDVGSEPSFETSMERTQVLLRNLRPEFRDNRNFVIEV